MGKFKGLVGVAKNLISVPQQYHDLVESRLDFECQHHMIVREFITWLQEILMPINVLAGCASAYSTCIAVLTPYPLPDCVISLPVI